MFTSINQLHKALLNANIPDNEAKKLSSLSKPCIWIQTEKVENDSEIKVGATKIGGCPDLSSGTSWPLRPKYPDASKRSNEYTINSKKDDSYWSWATPEQCVKFRDDYLQMASVVEKSFPLTFITQINLADAWGTGPLDSDFPKSGIISIFYDILEQPWGFDPNDHVATSILYHEDATNLIRQEVPKELSDIARYEPIEPPLKCKLNACMTPLPIDSAAFNNLELCSQIRDDYSEWWYEDDNSHDVEEGEDWECHRLGGWPTPIQGDMQTECALVAAGFYCGDGKAYSSPETKKIQSTANEWILLAQIGSDVNMMWGDSGQLYIWIRKEDLKNRNFSAARTILQCF